MIEKRKKENRIHNFENKKKTVDINTRRGVLAMQELGQVLNKIILSDDGGISHSYLIVTSKNLFTLTIRYHPNSLGRTCAIVTSLPINILIYF